MKPRQILLVLPFVLSFSLWTFAGTLRVPQDFPTVQAAVAASIAGDSIVVSPGLYAIPAAPCTLANGAQATCGLVLHNGTALVGSGPAQTVLDFSAAQIGILLQNGTATVKLAHLQNAGTALYAYVGSNITATNIIITNSNAGTELNQGNGYTIINTTIDGVHDASQTGSGIDVPFGGAANVQNNLVTHSDRAFTAGDFSGGTYDFNDAFGSIVSDWEICSAAGCTPVAAPANNVSFDPLYCPDFSLQQGSPAKNAGNPAILNPDGTRSDLGAYGGPEAILPSANCGAAPAISSISHSFATQGESINNFAVDGSNFQPTSTLSFSGTGINVNSYSLRSSTVLVASITFAPDALPSSRDVLITNGTEQSNPGGPITVLATPAGQITLTPQDRLLTPALASNTCTDTNGKTHAINGNTGQAKFTARVRTQKGKPAAFVPVRFQVTGANSTVTTIQTNAGGLATFSYVGVGEGSDTITASATVSGSNVVSNTAYAEWGQVTVAFKMPLPKDPSARWRVTTRVNDPGDVYHQCNGYYSLDLADRTPGLEAPVLTALEGAVTPELSNLSINSCSPPTFGTYRVLDHFNGFNTLYAHLNTGTVQMQQADPAVGGQVIAAMGSTGCSSAVHLHFQVRYSGTGARNDNLRVLIESKLMQEYCVSGQADINGVSCTAGSYSSSNNGLPFGHLDSPQVNTVLSSIVPVTGWALDDGTINSISILLDGSRIATAVYGASRPDVCNGAASVFTWPSFLECPNVGFSGQLDTTKILNGRHVLSILAIDNDGAGRVISASTIQVANP